MACGARGVGVRALEAEPGVAIVIEARRGNERHRVVAGLAPAAIGTRTELTGMRVLVTVCAGAGP